MTQAAGPDRAGAGRMRFSANLGFLWANRPLPDAIRAAQAAGFDAVECHWPYDTPPATVAGPWRAYRQAGALPDLSALSYIARAITPPGRSRRFDARFFMAPAQALLTPEPTAGCGELDEIAWLPLDDARALDLPAITRFVLEELGQRLEQPDRPLPFVRMVRGRHVVEHRD